MTLSSKFITMTLVGLMFCTVACQNKKGPATASGLRSVHFDFNESSLRSDMVKILDANANYLNNHKALKITVEGNCDERGTNEYNLALGALRAKAAADYIVRKGVNRSRLSTISYGEEKPVDRGHNEAAWYKNRRDDFVRQ